MVHRNNYKAKAFMLYQIYETQRSLMEPFADFAFAASKLFGDPHTVFGQLPMSQRASAGYDLIYRLGKDYEKPAFAIQSIKIGKADVAIHERVEINKPFCELRRFKRFTDDPATLGALKGEPAVLIVAPLSAARRASTLAMNCVTREIGTEVSLEIVKPACLFVSDTL